MPSSNTNLLLPKNSRSKGKNLKSLVNTVREAVRRRPSKRRPSKRRTSRRRTSRRESNNLDNLGKLGPVPVPVPEHPILDTSLDEAAAREAAAREVMKPRGRSSKGSVWEASDWEASDREAAQAREKVEKKEEQSTPTRSSDQPESLVSRSNSSSFNIGAWDSNLNSPIRLNIPTTISDYHNGSKNITRSAGKKRDKKKKSQKGKPVKSKNSHKKKK